jgi:hypothetical protein
MAKPNIPEGFDEGLNGEMEKQQKWANSQKNGSHWFKPVDPFYAPVEPLEWIIENFAAKGMLTVLGGVAGSGKSILVQYLLQLRDRQDLLNVKLGKAIYLTGLDSSETEIRRRAKSIGEGNGLRTVQIPDELLPFITNQVFYNDLKAKILEYEVDTIVFDTLADFHQGNLYEAADANSTMAAFRRLATATDVAIILITHTKKSAEVNLRYSITDIADSRIFGTKSDFGFAIKSEYQNDESNLIEIQCLKSRSPKNMPDLRALVRYDESSRKVGISRSERPFTTEADVVAEQKRRKERRKTAYELHEQGFSKRKIAEKLNVSHTTINKDLKKYKEIV